MCCCKDKCQYTTEVLTSGSVFALPQSAQDRIAKGHVTSIWTPRSGSNTLKTKMGRTVANDTVLATAHLTLKNADGNELLVVPFWKFMRDYNSPDPMPCNLKDVDLAQSTINLDSGDTNFNAAHAIEITFGFDCENGKACQ
ncbi:MAG: hypothetical protein R3A50_04805 [Saprospiraceae bacterium]